jgi:hypothetical protein
MTLQLDQIADSWWRTLWTLRSAVKEPDSSKAREILHAFRARLPPVVLDHVFRVCESARPKIVCGGHASHACAGHHNEALEAMNAGAAEDQASRPTKIRPRSCGGAQGVQLWADQPERWAA